MEQPNTGEKPVSRTRQEIIKECERIEESTLHSSKNHFKAAEQLSELHLWLGLPTAVLSAIACGLAFSEHNLIAGFLALIIAGLSAIITFVNPNEKAAIHLSAGNNYDSLLNKARIFRTIDCWKDTSEEVLTERLKELSDEKNRLNRSSPQVSKLARRAAKRGIKAGEGKYKTDQVAE